MALGWPARLQDGDVLVRPLTVRDGPAWVDARQRNVDWLRPWEATPPDVPPVFAADLATFLVMVRRLRSQARAGVTLPFAVCHKGKFAGQLTIGNIVRGSLNSGYAGYWVDERVAGQGVMPTALALVVDHCFGPVRLHRIEVNIRPENAASKRVVEKLALREEGLRRRLLHIDGAYRDHLSYAVVADEVPGGLLRRWHAKRGESTNS